MANVLKAAVQWGAGRASHRMNWGKQRGSLKSDKQSTHRVNRRFVRQSIQVGDYESVQTEHPKKILTSWDVW